MRALVVEDGSMVASSDAGCRRRASRPTSPEPARTALGSARKTTTRDHAGRDAAGHRRVRGRALPTRWVLSRSWRLRGARVRLPGVGRGSTPRAPRNALGRGLAILPGQSRGPSGRGRSRTTIAHNRIPHAAGFTTSAHRWMCSVRTNPSPTRTAHPASATARSHLRPLRCR